MKSGGGLLGRLRSQKRLRWLVLALVLLLVAWRRASSRKEAKGKKKERVKSISFSGGGAVYAYYIGIMEFLIDHYDLSDVKFITVSSSIWPVGSWLAGSTRPWVSFLRHWPSFVDHWNNRIQEDTGFGRWVLPMFFDSTEFFRKNWKIRLGRDGYKRANTNNISIAVTRFTKSPPFFYQELVKDFKSNDDFIDALCASQHLPGLFTELTRVRGWPAWDGCFSGRPGVDENTVHVSCLFPSHVSPRVPFMPWRCFAVCGVPEVVKSCELIGDAYLDAERAAHKGIFEDRGWTLLSEEERCSRRPDGLQECIDAARARRNSRGKRQIPRERIYDCIAKQVPIFESEIRAEEKQRRAENRESGESLDETWTRVKLGTRAKTPGFKHSVSSTDFNVWDP